MRITTVARNPKPSPRAAILKRFFSILIRAEYSDDECNNSDVIKSIMAINASHRLISDNDKGKFIFINLARCGTTLLLSNHLGTPFSFEL
jgi:hypothetical protein